MAQKHHKDPALKARHRRSVLGLVATYLHEQTPHQREGVKLSTATPAAAPASAKS